MRKVRESTLWTVSYYIHSSDEYLLSTHYAPSTERSQWGYDRGHWTHTGTSCSSDAYSPGGEWFSSSDHTIGWWMVTLLNKILGKEQGSTRQQSGKEGDHMTLFIAVSAT